MTMLVTRSKMVISTYAALLALSVAPAQAHDFTMVHKRLEAECAAGTFRGVVVIQSVRQRVFEHVCGAVDDKRTPISTGTRFKIFSTSKLLTAVAVMRLVERGTLGLDAPITDYIPAAPPAWRSVTIRHLLQHESGLPDQTEQVLAAYKSDYPAALSVVLAKDRAARVVPETTPGTTWRYNNFGYDLLATAVADVMRVPFESAIDDLVFRPAGMKTAIVERARYIDGKPGSEVDADLAQGYNGSANKPTPATSFEFVQLGSGSVHAKVADFAALDRALGSGKLLTAATLQLMVSNLKPDDGPPYDRGYGLGMMVRGKAPLVYVGHDGGNNGFVSDFERYPDGSMLIVLSNIGFAQIDWIRSAVGEALSPVRR